VNAEAVIISRHAWRQFVTRHKTWLGSVPACPNGTLRRLLSVAQPEDLGGGAVLRLLDNGMMPVRYYTAEGWRFVVNEAGTYLLTCERVIHRKRKLVKKKARRR